MELSPQSRLIEILMIEDNPGDARLAMEAFKDAKLANTLRWVEDGESAIAFLRKEGKFSNAPRPDIILLDLHLPKKDGHELLAEIKENPDLCDIPVIMLISSKAEENLLKAHHLPADCTIIKPITLEQLVSALHCKDDFRLMIIKGSGL